jgi:hypothetical protein
MAILSMDALSAAFAAHTEGQPAFTRRMAVTLADMDGTSPRELVLRLERLGLVKGGSWEWFKHHGGITAAQADQVRAERLPTPGAAK